MPFTIGACTRIPHDLGQKAVVVVCILSAFSEVLAVYLTKTFFIVEGSVKRFIIDLLFRLKSGADPHRFPPFYGNRSDISELIRKSKKGT